MSYNLTIEKKGDVLWVTATGMRSLETVISMSKDIMAACAEQKVRRVLIDVRELKERMKMGEIYEISDKYFPKIRDRSVITHSAIVDLKEFEHEYKFFETVAMNRGFNLRLFSDPDEAVEWLRK